MDCRCARIGLVSARRGSLTEDIEHEGDERFFFSSEREKKELVGHPLVAHIAYRESAGQLRQAQSVAAP